MATEVLGQIDLDGTLVTADALHTVKATAELICEAGGEFVLPVKENRQALFDALDGLPWDEVPIAHSATDHAMAGSLPAPSSCFPRRRTCRSRTSARFS